MKQFIKLSFLSFCGLLFCLTSLTAQTVGRNQCFPFEKLSAEQRKKAEEVLLKALDGEALYTIAGGLKPMSSGFQSLQMQVNLPRIELSEAQKIVSASGGKQADTLSSEEKVRLSQAKQSVERAQAFEKVRELKEIFTHWRCGDEIFADVHHYAQTYEGKRSLDAVVFSKSSLKKMLTEKQDFFSRLGVFPNSHPLEALYAVEYNPTSSRFAGYGYLFGYPDYAVRFFVQASDDERFTGKFVERGFISLPTFAGENRFVYAVPKNYVETETDKMLRAKAENVFNEYKRRRAEFIGEGKKGVVEMLRNWFCKDKGQCSPASIK